MISAPLRAVRRRWLGLMMGAGIVIMMAPPCVVMVGL
jgi:hypothetical protein